jgi:NAD(P)-dependent dehydrogenase (short-subunit alcohol dehydrogenase family)
LATANAFAQRGALVAIGDLDAAGARVAAEGIGRGATGLALDVTDRVSFESFLDEVDHRLGPLDGWTCHRRCPGPAAKEEKL